MKIKYCFSILLLATVVVVKSQTQYKNRLAGKVFIQKKHYPGPYYVYFFKDSTYYNYAESFMLKSYTYGSYKYINKDTVLLKSKYSNLIDSNQQIKEYKADGSKIVFKVSNKHPCSSNQFISIYLYKGNEELYAFENMKFTKEIEFSTDSLIMFDNIVIRLNQKFRIDYNLNDSNNNIIEIIYDYLPDEGYNVEDLILIHKGNGFYIKGDEILYSSFKGKEYIQNFIKRFPEPCYLDR